MRANKAVYSNKLCNELWTKFQQCLEMEDFHCYVTYRDLNIFMCVLISKRLTYLNLLFPSGLDRFGSVLRRFPVFGTRFITGSPVGGS